jgi:multiple sugar transport system ATP-binding protein
VAKVVLENVCKSFPQSDRTIKPQKEGRRGKPTPRVNILKSIDLTIADGEFMVLVGPSGCGKSTLLRLIAGLEELTEGKIWVGEKLVNDLPPKARDIAMVFQNYALYPHLSVFDNIAFGLRRMSDTSSQWWQDVLVGMTRSLPRGWQFTSAKEKQLGERVRLVGRELPWVGRSPAILKFF